MPYTVTENQFSYGPLSEAELMKQANQPQTLAKEVWSGTNIPSSVGLPFASYPAANTANSINPGLYALAGGGYDWTKLGGAMSGAKAATGPSAAGTYEAGGGGAGGGGASGLEGYPGYTALMQDLSGVISPDVKTQIYQAMAERGVATGSPGAPSNDAATMRAIGLTSDALRQRAQQTLSPLWQQQVSEAGQTGRLAMSLSAEMDRLQYSTSAQERMQGAQIAAQNALAQMEQAGLDRRQAQALAAQLQQLTISENAQDRRQANELAAAMDRLKVGAANQRDLEILQGQIQAGLQSQAQGAAYQLQSLRGTQEAGLQTLRGQQELGLAGVQNTAAMERLQAQLAQAASEAEAQRILERYRVDEQAKLGYAGIYNPYRYPSYGTGTTNTGTGTTRPTISLVTPASFDWASQKYTPASTLTYNWSNQLTPEDQNWYDYLASNGLSNPNDFSGMSQDDANWYDYLMSGGLSEGEWDPEDYYDVG